MDTKLLDGKKILQKDFYNMKISQLITSCHESRIVQKCCFRLYMVENF